MTPERVPPFSEEAERAVIGSAIIEYREVIPVAIGRWKITDESFYIPAHRRIWMAVSELYEKNRPVDVLTITQHLKEGGYLDAVGGSLAINRIIDATPTSAHADYYCQIVQQKHQLRRLVSTCRSTENEAYETEDASSLVCCAPDRFQAIVETPQDSHSNSDLMAETLKSWQDASDGKRPAIGLETPWKTVTFLTCGLEVGLTILAGRPSAGKTTWEDQVADHIATGGVPVYRVTMDSTRKELLDRSICRNAEVSMPKMKFGYGTKKQHADATSAANRLGSIPLFIDDRCTDIRDIRARARAMKSKHKIRLMTVDYIQLVRAAEMGRSEWDTVARVTYVSNQLKELAFELMIPILVLCQLSRNVEKEGRDPQLSDLRDSGAIEQDASKVIFLYLDGAKKKQMESLSPGATKHKRPVICNVMKHKNGETGTIPMWLYPPYFRFHPAKFDASSGVMFTDDDLPQTRHDDERDLKEHPQYMPKPEEVTAREEQEEFDD